MSSKKKDALSFFHSLKAVQSLEHKDYKAVQSIKKDEIKTQGFSQLKTAQSMDGADPKSKDDVLARADDCNIIDQAHLFDTINFDVKKMTTLLLLSEVKEDVDSNHLDIANHFLKEADKAMRMRVPTFKMYAGCTLNHCPLGTFYRSLYNTLKRHMIIIVKK